VATGVSVGSATISATSGSVSGSASLSVAAPPLVSIAVTPSSASVAPNGTQQFTATGTFADHSTRNITSSVTWSVSTGATINSAGLATGVTPGAVPTITATSGAISGTATLTVTNPLVSIAVTPPTASVAPNGTQQFTASGTYANHTTQNITNSVTWNASAGATITQAGLATGVTPNTTSTIMAAQGNISGTATLTVTNPLVSIAATAPLLTIAQNTSVQFTAIGTYADHSTQNITTTVAWNSSNTSVATISNSAGTQGVATSLNTAGTTQITATIGSVTSPPVTLTVTSAALVSIAVTPANPQIVYQTQQQFTAIGTYSDSSTQDITNSVTWASGDNTKITVTVSGLATGVNTTTSPVTITASDPHTRINGFTMATVTQASVVSIAITPTIASLAQNTSRQYTAIATLANGSTLNVTNVATWTSLNTSIATVHNGLVAAQAVTNNHNPVNIQVTYNSVNQTLLLDVTNATAQTVTVTPVTANIPVGVAQRFNAVATFSDGTSQDITQNAFWTTSPSGIANVNQLGGAVAVAAGTTTVTATFENVPGSAQLTVSTATLTTIAVRPAQTLLAPGSTLTYQAIGHYSDGSSFFISNLVTWSSTNANVVSINTAGVATGQSAGPANISAIYQSVTSNSASVVVTSSPLASIAVTPSPATIPADVAQQFTAIGTFADQSQQNLTTNVTWASSQPTVATISNAAGQQGLATGVATGQTAITAVFASIVSNQATLTVSNATLMSIVITPNNFTASVGSTVNYRAVGTFSDSSTVDLTTQASWASSMPSISTINSFSGVASTASPGTTQISAAFTQNGVTITGTTNLTVH
jgi:hypothetical protein